MSVFKRGEVWWYKFRFANRLIRESTKTTSKTVAPVAALKVAAVVRAAAAARKAVAVPAVVVAAAQRKKRLLRYWRKGLQFLLRRFFMTSVSRARLALANSSLSAKGERVLCDAHAISDAEANGALRDDVLFFL